MLTWLLLRQAAMMRHRFWNRIFEPGDPDLWKLHKEMVRRFYGM
jgi:hypothetical protein